MALDPLIQPAVRDSVEGDIELVAGQFGKGLDGATHGPAVPEEVDVGVNGDLLASHAHVDGADLAAEPGQDGSAEFAFEEVVGFVIGGTRSG